MDNDAKSPSAVVGEIMRRLRHEYGRNQDDVATSARTMGLAWTRATVAALETGRRSLDLGEYFLLPVVLNHAFGVEVDLPGLVPIAGRVRFGPEAVGSGIALRAGMAGTMQEVALDDLDTPWTRKATRMVREAGEAFSAARRVWPAAKPRDLVAAERDSSQLVEVRAGERLGVPPFEVALAARRLWGRSLTEERNHRLSEASENPRSARAYAGHVTRTLTAELRQLLGQASARAERRD
jgi:transcriptional regulator with XRE-family HTH domain